jgi:hypothetical protein
MNRISINAEVQTFYKNLETTSNIQAPDGWHELSFIFITYLQILGPTVHNLVAPELCPHALSNKFFTTSK